MDPISGVFGRMDAWRHFPNYQLERRADIFFAVYLPEVLEAKLGYPVHPELVPEFPVRIGTIFPNIKTDKSYKIDYLSLSADATRAVFVELKTDAASRRSAQDRYLAVSCSMGLTQLLDGLIKIFLATNSKRKYYCLLKHLEKIKLLQIPEVLHETMARRDLHGVNEAASMIKILSRVSTCTVVYLQPNNSDEAESNVITFREFADVVRKHKDAASQRFAESLVEWAQLPAGETDRAT